MAKERWRKLSKGSLKIFNPNLQSDDESEDIANNFVPIKTT